MTDQDDLSMEERISRNDSVRAMTQALKVQTEQRLQLSHEEIMRQKLDEDHAVAQAELDQEVNRAVASGTLSEAKAAMLRAAAGIVDAKPAAPELSLPVAPPVTPATEAPKFPTMVTLAAPAFGEEK